MILFLYGEDNYRSKQKLDAIKEKYISKSLGDTNLSVTDFTDKDIGFVRISRMILTMPFLAKKRLVIIKNLPSTKNKKLQDQIEKFLSRVPETTLLVFYEDGVPDKRSSLFKRLNRTGQAQEFKPLEGYQLRQWIKTEVENQNSRIDSSAVDKLIFYVGNNLWRMSNEIQKLVAYNPKLITCENVELLTKAKIGSNIFSLIDCLGNKDGQKASKELHKLLDAGENELYILTMIVYQFRNLLIIKDLLENSDFSLDPARDGEFRASNFQLAKRAGLRPFVVQKTTTQAKNFTMNQLKKIYKALLDYDVRIKLGKIEPRLALDMIIVELSKR